MKQQFFTDEFYNNSITTVNVLNKIIQKKLADVDMYASGEFLSMEVYETDEAYNILSSIISDVDEYKKYNNKRYTDDHIGMSALHALHLEYYGRAREIKWSHTLHQFIQ
jgi:hypothetical protein